MKRQDFMQPESTKEPLLISVVIPCYNPRQEHFKDSIESILAQSYSNWETIIINDGSNDKCKAFLENYIEKLNDKRISIFHLNKNFGVSVAKNKGIELAKGEIITFLDADDIHLPWYYQDVINTFRNNTNQLILATPELYYYSLWKKKYFVIPTFYNQFLEHSDCLNNNKEKKKFILTFPPRFTFKKELFKLIKFDINLRTSEDVDFCLQISDNGEIINRLFLNTKFGYLYRIYQSRKRLTQKMDNLVQGAKIILNKYNDEDSTAYKFLNQWKQNGLWRLASLKENSLFYNKIDTIKFVTTMFIKYKLLPEFLQIDYMHLNEIFPDGNKRNNIIVIREKFRKYLEKYTVNSTKQYAKFYAMRLFERVF